MKDSFVDGSEPLNLSEKLPTGPVAIRSFLATIVVLAAFLSPLGNTLTDRVIRPFEYAVRGILGQSPQLDPRIKMLAFDDRTVSRLRRPDLTIDDWQVIFASIAAQKPDQIFIDRIFGFPLGKDFDRGISQANADQFVKTLQNLPVPITVGSFYRSTPHPHRKPLSLSQPNYTFSKYTDFGKQGENEKIAVTPSHVYGPDPRILPAFSQIGLINNLSHGHLVPFQRVTTNKVIFHTALLITGETQFKSSGVFHNNFKLPLGSDNSLTLNFSQPETYPKSAKSLIWLLEKINQRASLDWIQPGDIVAILPMMFTGNQDTKDSPIGRIAGSYINATAISNALQNNWVREQSTTPVWIVFAGVFAALIAAKLSLTWFFSLLVITPLIVSLIGILSFSYFTHAWDWAFINLAVIVPSLTVFAYRSKFIDKLKTKAAAKAIEGEKVRKLLHIVCHDIANPLMVVSGRAIMMGADGSKVLESPKTATHEDKILFAADQMGNIIKQVRSLEAIEMGKVQVTLGPCSLRETFYFLSASFADSLINKDVSLSHNLKEEAEDLSVIADSIGLENFVLANIISNAIKFSNAGDTVELTATKDGEWVQVAIRDRGIGIPKELIDKIFSSTEVTSRAGTASEAGTGFGMPIVKSYVERFGGTIRIESKSIDESPQDHGTTVLIRLKFTEDSP